MNDNIPPGRAFFLSSFFFLNGKICNFDNMSKQYHQTTVIKKGYVSPFLHWNVYSYFLLGPQRSVGLPDVHSGYGFAIGKLQLTHL